MTKVFDFCKKKLALEKTKFKQKLFVIKLSSQEKNNAAAAAKNVPKSSQVLFTEQFFALYGSQIWLTAALPERKKEKTSSRRVSHGCAIVSGVLWFPFGACLSLRVFP